MCLPLCPSQAVGGRPKEGEAGEEDNLKWSSMKDNKEKNRDWQVDKEADVLTQHPSHPTWKEIVNNLEEEPLNHKEIVDNWKEEQLNQLTNEVS